MTRIKDPKQVASTIRQILLILMRSSNVCFMAGHEETEGRREAAEPRTAGLCLMLMLSLLPPACARVSKISAQLPGVRYLPPHTRLQWRNSAPSRRAVNERAHAFIFVSIELVAIISRISSLFFKVET